MADFQFNLVEKLALKMGLNYAEHRSDNVKKIISELSSPALWTVLATAVPLVAQLFTSIGNPHLAALGGAIVSAYAIAVQLKNALLTVPPPGSAPAASAAPVAAKMAETATTLSHATDKLAALMAAAKAASEKDANALETFIHHTPVAPENLHPPKAQ